MAKAKRKYISKTRDGRFRINSVDSSGKPYRPSFATMAEAESALNQITAKKATGKFVVGLGEATFSEALDDLVERKKHEDVGKGYRDGINTAINKHLRPTFGAFKLKEFADKQMVPVDVWMKHQAAHYHTGAKRLEFIRTVFSMTFDEAIRLRKMASPNPVQEYKLQVPRQNQKEEREALTLEQMSALVKAVLTKTKKDRSELAWCTRWMMVLLGMLAGLRNEECSGLYWDCVHFESRTISVLRIWRDGEGIVPDTKSEGGKRIIPMSPILAAALLHYRQRLVSMGRKLEGPVLVCKAGIVKPEAISSQHWEVIFRKAGLPDTNEDGRHTFYSAGRHTAINLWRACGIELDTVADLAGDIVATIAQNYRHTTSIARFEVIGLAVEARGVRSNRPKEVIDALGRVLYDRWLAEGVFDEFDIGCAPPPTAPGAPILALPGPAGNIIDLVPIVVSTPGAPAVVEDDEEPSIEATRARQIKRAFELKAQGWGKTRIAAKLHVDPSTVAAWFREADIPHTRGKHTPDVFREKKARFRQLRAQHPQWGTVELARALEVRPGWVTNQARAERNPMPHVVSAYKLDRHEAAIRQMADAGQTFRQMEKVLGVSFSAISLFAKKRGIKTKRWGGGERVEQYDADIIRGVDAGLDAKAIAKPLPISHSSVARRINELGLKTTRAGRGLKVEQFDADIIRLAGEGKNGKETAIELHAVHHSTITKRRKALGIEPGRPGPQKTRT
jgi:integrase